MRLGLNVRLGSPPHRWIDLAPSLARAEQSIARHRSAPGNLGTASTGKLVKNSVVACPRPATQFPEFAPIATRAFQRRLRLRSAGPETHSTDHSSTPAARWWLISLRNPTPDNLTCHGRSGPSVGSGLPYPAKVADQQQCTDGQYAAANGQADADTKIPFKLVHRFAPQVVGDILASDRCSPNGR